MTALSQNELALRLRALHNPSNPLIVINVYDAATASVASSHPSAKALATASYAIAAVAGVEDEELSLSDNLLAISRIASVAAKAGLPLTADLQDGYADVGETVRMAIDAGAVGCNLEDVDNRSGKLRTVEDAAGRIREGMRAAAEKGVPDFCINARTDVLFYGGNVSDAIERGRAYLDAGAVCVFVWGGPAGRGLIFALGS